MIKCVSTETNFATRFTNGRHQASSDVPPEKGGSDAGFRPHELLEAALAACMNISLRMYAERYRIPLAEAVVEVSLNRQTPGEAVFEYRLELSGPITEEQRQELLQHAASCSVHQTLSRKISFQPMSTR